MSTIGKEMLNKDDNKSVLQNNFLNFTLLFPGTRFDLYAKRFKQIHLII